MKITHPHRKPDVLLQEVGDESLLYSAEGEAVHVLNPTARYIWDRCDGQHTAAQIAQELGDSFAIAPEYDVLGDIARTLLAFAEKGLLQGEGGSVALSQQLGTGA